MKKIGKEQVRKARQTLAKYKEGKAVLDLSLIHISEPTRH